jgi:5-methyltetrahydropteroyltriglutamate--homocysteine methyltransferase
MSLLTTAAGSYPKIGDSTEEQKFRRALHQLDKGEISDDDLLLVQQEVTKEVIEEQVSAGVDIVTDGGIGWGDPLTYEARHIFGFKITGLIRYFDTNTFYREPIAEARLAYKQPILVEDFKFASGVSTKPVKAVMTGPYTLARLSKNTFYRDFGQLASDLTFILHREAQALAAAGCTMLQFDEPAILHHKDDWKLFSRLYETMTSELSGVEKILFLNFGSLEGLYPRVCKLNVETIGCELTKDHPNWRTLKTSPLEKKLMAGVIDARNTKMETHEELDAAVARLSEITSLDRVALSPSHSLEFLPRDAARKKLANLASFAKQKNGAQVA